MYSLLADLSSFIYSTLLANSINQKYINLISLVNSCQSKMLTKLQEINIELKVNYKI